MPKVLLYIWLQFIAFALVGQSFVLKGSVQEDISKDPIHMANVYLKESKLGTISSVNGEYELAIPDSLLKDTLVFSALGFKEQKVALESLYPETNFLVFLQDSMFLLDEVVAFCYDYIEALHWKSKIENKSDYLLTFVSKDISNVSNFILLIKERFGQGKKKKNTYVWKKVEIPGLNGNTNILMKFFRCGYCPDPQNITVTFDVENSEVKDILKDDEYKLLLARYFQEILDKTFENGINISQLEKRNKIYYLPAAEDGFTGKVYGYFETGQKGLRGEITEGVKDKKWEYWYQNSNKRMVAFFNKGVKEGLWVSWYKNGSLRIKNNYSAGRLEGNNYWWFENGTLKKISTYKEGILQGKVEWEENGALKEKRGIFETTTDEDIEKIIEFKFQDKAISTFIKQFSNK